MFWVSITPARRAHWITSVPINLICTNRPEPWVGKAAKSRLEVSEQSLNQLIEFADQAVDVALLVSTSKTRRLPLGLTSSGLLSVSKAEKQRCRDRLSL